MNANTIVDTIYKTVMRIHTTDDPMRWPYQVGMLETKVRELVYQINDQQQTIDKLTADLEKARNELSTMV